MELPPLLSIAFTGHRTVDPDDILAINRGADQLAQLGWDGPVVFHDGLAAGFDYHMLQQLWPSVNSVEVFHPVFDYRLKAVHKGLTKFSKQPFEEWLNYVSICQQESCLPIPYNGDKGRFQRRNMHMVDESHVVVSYFNGTPGGTANCIAYAEKVGKPVFDIRNIDDDIRKRIEDIGWGR